MNVNVTFRHMEADDDLREYAREKLNKAMRLLANDTTEANVVMSQQKFRQRAEVTAMTNGIVIKSEEETSDMFLALDRITDKLEIQVRRYHDKIRKRKPHREGGIKRALVNVISPEMEEEEEEEGRQPTVVQTRHISIKPMSLDEAIMQMELIESDFLVFTNARSYALNVLHRRKDGDYELIEPIEN